MLSKKDEIVWFFMQHLKSLKGSFCLSGRYKEYQSVTVLK